MAESNMKDNNFLIWEGIYEEWKDAPAKGEPFNETIWVEKQIERTKYQINLLDEHLAIPECSQSSDYILSVVVALYGNEKRKEIKVLDFGGGMAHRLIATAH